MNRMLIIVAVAMIAGVSFAEGESPSAKPIRDMTPQEREASHLRSMEKRARRHGGMVAKKGSKQGRVVFVNEQQQVPSEELESVAETIRIRDRINVEFTAGAGEKTTPMNAASKKAAIGADVVIFLTECDKCETMMLAAPEGAWSIVNALAVCKGAGNDDIKKSRMAKMTERGFYCAAGAMNSQYPNSLMGAVRRPSDLDKLSIEPPVDVIMRTLESLSSVGVKPQIYATYKKACEEGWAPQPTNDVQKAIWDKVHAMPTESLKIKPETKKQEK